MKALVPVRTAPAPLVQLAAAGVAAEVKVEGQLYEIRIVGCTSGVTARLVATLRDGSVVELGSLDVPGGCAGASRFPIVLPRRERLEHVYLEILGGNDLCLRLEAPRPPKRRTPSAVRVAGLAMLFAAVAAGGGGLAFAVPQPPVLVGPIRATAGETVRIAYATHALGSGRYRAVRDDGTPIGTGVVTAPDGDFPLALPRSAARHRVAVELRVRGPLGDAARSVSFPVVAPDPTTASMRTARVVSFSAHRDLDARGESILASYLAVAQSGVLSVVDEHGRVVAHAPFSHTGTQRLTVGSKAETHLLAARLEVRDGDSRASSTVALPPAILPATTLAVTPAAAAASAGAPPGPNDAPASADDPGTTTPPPGGDPSATSDDPFAVVGNPIAGRPFTVAIRRAASHMKLRLENDAGNAVAEAAVPGGASRVSLTAPAATTAHIYYLTCSYSTGNGQEVVVRSVRVSPR